MNSSEKENMAKSYSKTKTELEEGSINPQNILEEKEKELETLGNELENAKAKILELEKQNKELGPLRKDLKDANTRLSELEKHEKELEGMRKDLEEANARIMEFEKQEMELETMGKDLEISNARITELEEQEKELETLRKDLENANTRITEFKKQEKELKTLRRNLENANARIKEFEEQEKELETLRKDLESEISPPVEQIAELPKTGETISENNAYSKEAFRIDLYPYKGHYQGKVAHLLTNEKKAFKGVDHKAIADFINEHLTQPGESNGESEPVASVTAKSPVETQTPIFKTATVRKFTPEWEGKIQKEKSIPQNRIFKVALVVDPLESIVEENLPCPYKISVYAKRMGGGLKQILGKTKGQITTAGELTARIHCSSLPAGVYRFVAFGTINVKKGVQESIVQFQKNTIFKVA